MSNASILAQYFYVPAAAFTLSMFGVGATFAVNPQIASLFPAVVGLGIGIALGAFIGAR